MPEQIRCTNCSARFKSSLVRQLDGKNYCPECYDLCKNYLMRKTQKSLTLSSSDSSRKKSKSSSTSKKNEKVKIRKRDRIFKRSIFSSTKSKSKLKDDRSIVSNSSSSLSKNEMDLHESANEKHYETTKDSIMVSSNIKTDSNNFIDKTMEENNIDESVCNGENKTIDTPSRFSTITNFKNSKKDKDKIAKLKLEIKSLKEELSDLKNDKKDKYIQKLKKSELFSQVEDEIKEKYEEKFMKLNIKLANTLNEMNEIELENFSLKQKYCVK